MIFFYFLLKVYTVESESALSEYIPFATTRIVHYDCSITPSISHNHIMCCLQRLQEKVMFWHLCMVSVLGTHSSQLFGSTLLARQSLEDMYHCFLVSLTSYYATDARVQCTLSNALHVQLSLSYLLVIVPPKMN
jgi:hypothetical protein